MKDFDWFNRLCKNLCGSPFYLRCKSSLQAVRPISIAGIFVSARAQEASIRGRSLCPFAVTCVEAEVRGWCESEKKKREKGAGYQKVKPSPEDQRRRTILPFRFIRNFVTAETMPKKSTKWGGRGNNRGGNEDKAYFGMHLPPLCVAPRTIRARDVLDTHDSFSCIRPLIPVRSALRAKPLVLQAPSP